MSKYDVMSLCLTHFQLMYQMRKHCHVREAFFDKWCENIKGIGLSEDDENTMLVYTILIFKQPLKKRIRFGNEMLGFIQKITESAIKRLKEE